MQVRSADEAAALLREEDRLAVPLGPGQPAGFLHALAGRSFRDLRVFGALLVDLYEVFTRPGVTLLSGFYGPVERGLQESGHAVHFLPGDFRRFARFESSLAPRVLATAAAPPDAEGWCSLSLHAGATVEALHAAAADPERLLVVETSPRFPRTVGLPPVHSHALHVSEIDVMIEGERAPVTLPEAEPSEAERAIAGHAASFVHAGCTLQTGIGGIPNAVVRLLAEGEGGDYGIHTEMMTDGLMELQRAGKVSNLKGVYDGASVCTFALGSRALYDWLDANETVRFLPVEAVNDPSIIARCRGMISINGAMGVDLGGQVVADRMGPRQHSGIGGHEDFVTGAAFSPGGRSLICLPSTVTVGGRTISRIVNAFPEGSCITTPRHQVDAVVTEHGVAELAARTVEERAEALVAVAHPQVRDALREGAKELPAIEAEDAAS